MFVGRKVVIKRPDEISQMREAGRINARALAAVRAAIRPGVTTAELDQIAEDIILQAGAEPAFKHYPGPYPYPATTTISINEALVHGIPNGTVLEDGDIVSVDCGTVYQGYVADSAFTVGVGQVSAQAEKLIQVTREALYVGIDQMRAGHRVGDISAAVQALVEGHGFFVTREYTGHGVGRSMHEGPQVPNFGVKGRGMVLRPGMTIALEPMVLIGTEETRVMADQWTVASADGSLTAHFEHTIAVTEQEPIILTEI